MEDQDAEDPELQHALAMSLEDKPGMLQMALDHHTCSLCCNSSVSSIAFTHGNDLCVGQKDAGSRHAKSKHKSGTRSTKTKDSADDSSAAASIAQPVKGKGKVQKNAARTPKKGKSAGRVGLINPTAAEIKTAFSMLNPHNRSVINAQDIARVGPLLRMNLLLHCSIYRAAVYTWLHAPCPAPPTLPPAPHTER